MFSLLLKLRLNTAPKELRDSERISKITNIMILCCAIIKVSTYVWEVKRILEVRCPIFSPGEPSSGRK